MLLPTIFALEKVMLRSTGLLSPVGEGMPNAEGIAAAPSGRNRAATGELIRSLNPLELMPDVFASCRRICANELLLIAWRLSAQHATRHSAIQEYFPGYMMHCVRVVFLEHTPMYMGLGCMHVRQGMLCRRT